MLYNIFPRVQSWLADEHSVSCATLPKLLRMGTTVSTVREQRRHRLFDYRWGATMTWAPLPVRVDCHPPPGERGGILRVGEVRVAVSPTPDTVRIRMGSTDCHEWDCWACHTPGTQTLCHIRTSGVVVVSRESGRRRWTWSDGASAYSSRVLQRFIIRTDRSPDWVRLLSDCVGRTGHHRRTGGNRSVPGLIPTYMTVSSLCKEAGAHRAFASGVTDTESAQDSQSQARADLKTVASIAD